MMRWIAAAALVLACSVEAKAQTSCFKITSDLTQCADGTSFWKLNDEMVMVNQPPQPAPIYSPPPELFNAPGYNVPMESREWLPTLLTVPELVDGLSKAKQDCRANIPGNCVERWNKFEAELVSRGMCNGRPGQANVDRRWQKCER